MFDCAHRISVDCVRHSQQIERLCHTLRILQVFKHRQRLVMCLEPTFCLPGVDQPVPQSIETLGLELAIGQPLCEIECLAQPLTSLPIVPARTLKLAQRFIGLSSCSMECSFGAFLEMRLGLERSCKVFDSGTRCVERHGSFSRALPILQRF